MSLGTRKFDQLRDKDADDVRRMVYANRSALHYSTDTKECTDPLNCKLCTNAARLAVQWYRPILERRIVESIQTLYGIRCESHHMSSDD